MHNVGLGTLGAQPNKKVKMLELAILKTSLTPMQFNFSFMFFPLMPTLNSTSRHRYTLISNNFLGHL